MEQRLGHSIAIVCKTEEESVETSESNKLDFCQGLIDPRLIPIQQAISLQVSFPQTTIPIIIVVISSSLVYSIIRQGRGRS